MEKIKSKPILCIICKKKKRIPHSLFCKKCGQEDYLVKINALRKSREYQDGRLINTGMNQHGGRLPRR